VGTAELGRAQTWLLLAGHDAQEPSSWKGTVHDALDRGPRAYRTGIAKRSLSVAAFESSAGATDTPARYVPTFVPAFVRSSERHGLQTSLPG
jgi:hypothetical protein